MLLVSGAERPSTGGSQKNMAKSEKKYASGSPSKSHRGEVPNKVFAATDPGFRAACESAGVQPTARQASKWRMGKGSAFKAKKG